MWGSYRNSSQLSNKQKQEKEWFAASFRAENFIPGLVIGFIFGMLLDLSKPAKSNAKKKNFLPGKPQERFTVSSNGDQDVKMCMAGFDSKTRPEDGVRKDCISMCSCCHWHVCSTYAKFKVASFSIPCSDRSLLRQWEQCGQPKIVVTCKNQQEMNKLKEAAENIGLPTFVVADAGRTQVPVSAGSKTVLTVGPGMLYFIWLPEYFQAKRVGGFSDRETTVALIALMKQVLSQNIPNDKLK
ncbi:hypothetical protein Pint_12852 [Pistacia integerrima]|uniref:Uncharacterized protein n=1 Tax=Pistacia integerrima TaxID=434235 RepID=A0ACC0YC27_9ROSI|nr:hypothetical protein Pint_12852 [Pistacia integerrima]